MSIHEQWSQWGRLHLFIEWLTACHMFVFIAHQYFACCSENFMISSLYIQYKFTCKLCIIYNLWFYLIHLLLMSRSLFILSCLHFGSYYYSSPSGFSRTTVFIKENGISYIIVKLLGFFFPLHWPPYMTLFIWYWTGSSPTPSPSCSLQPGYTGAALIWFLGRGWFEWLWWSACRAACCWHGCFVYLCVSTWHQEVNPLFV